MKNKNKIVFFIILGIVFALIAGELYLRIANKEINFVKNPSYSYSCYEKTSRHWIALKPNSFCIFKSQIQAFDETTIFVNSLGLRNPEISLKKPPQTTRILYVGDSYIFGLGVKEHEAIPRLSEKYIQQLYQKKIQTINAGVPARGPGGYYLYMKYEGLKLDPDMFVVGFFIYDDIFDADNVKTWKDIDTDGLPTAIDSGTTEVRNGELIAKNLPFFLKIKPLQHSRLAVMLGYYWPNRIHKKNYLVNQQVCLYKKGCHILDTEKNNKKKLFLGMKKLADTYKKKLLVLIIPTEFQINPEARYKYKFFVSLSPSDTIRPNEEFKAFFEKNTIEYLDLLPILKKYRSEELYFEQDNHWNPNGNKIIAQEVSKKITELLEDKNTPPNENKNIY